MSFQAYLDAKRTVDDRALNRRVLERFRDELPESARILEIGAGIGVMLERLHSWDCLPRNVHYTALDIDPENIATARKRLLAGGFESRGDELRFDDGFRHRTVSFEVADVMEFLSETDRRWDAVVGHAVADLFDLHSAVPTFLSHLEPSGLCYFPITFDGGTTFDPPHPLDDRVEHLYHRHMDAGRGSSAAGRELLGTLQVQEGVEVLTAGGSDWLVYPRGGSYPEDEADFLHYIFDTVAGVLDSHPDIDEDAFSEWLQTRTRQVEREELVYVAHQLDVLGKRTQVATTSSDGDK